MRFARIVTVSLMLASGAAMADVPTLQLPAEVNPVRITVPVAKGSLWPAKLGLSNITCPSGYTSPDPIVTVKLTRAGLAPSVASRAGAALWDVGKGKKGVCKKQPMPAGSYPLRLIGNQVATRYDVLIATNEPIRFASSVATRTVADNFAKPLIVPVKVDATQLATHGCTQSAGFAMAPSLIVKHAGSTIDASVALYGGDGSVGIRVLGPIENMTAAALASNLLGKCATGGRGYTNSLMARGTYAVFLAADKASSRWPMHIVIRNRHAEAPDALSVVLPLPEGAPAAQRALDERLPLLDSFTNLLADSREGDELFARFLAMAPADSLVFATRAEGDIKAGEPLFLRHADKDGWSLISLDGWPVNNLPAGGFTATPPATITLPSPLRDSDLTFSEARYRSVPEDDPIHDKFLAAEQKYEKCADKIWKVMVGDLPYDWDLLIIRGTRSTSVKESAQRKIDKKCGGAKMAKTTQAYVEALNQARSKRRQGAIDAFVARAALPR